MKTLQTLVSVVALISLAASCAPSQKENSSNYETEIGSAGMDTASGAASEVSASGIDSHSTKWTKAGELEMKVSNVDSFTRSIAAYVKSVGGIVTNQELEYSQGESHTINLNADTCQRITTVTPHATISVRVPASQLEALIFKASDLSSFPVRRSLNLQDKTLDYLRNKMKAENRIKLINAGGEKQTSGEQVGISDYQIDRTIENLQIQNDVQYSTVHIIASQNPIIVRENMAYADPSAYRSPARARFVESLSVGWRAITDVFFGLMRLWAFLLIGIPTYILVKRYRSRPKEEMAARLAE